MNYIRYMWLLLAVLLALPGSAQYNPQNPPEPAMLYSLKTGVVPADGGSVSGSGKYKAGTQVTVSASPHSGFRFSHWEDEKGTVLSDKSSMRYTMPSSDVVLRARFIYNPTNPAEPEKKDYATVKVSVSPSDAGWAYGEGKFVVGSTVTLQAGNNSGFRFRNWTLGDEVVSEEEYFHYVVRSGDNALKANFDYAPSNPAEPGGVKILRSLDIRIVPSEAGYTNPWTGNRYAVGETVRLTAYESQGYTFREWTDKDGNRLSSAKEFDFTMPERNTVVEARYDYSPASPSEPGNISLRRNVIYGGRVSVTPGSQTFYEILLENADEITGITVDVTVPEAFSQYFQEALKAAAPTERSKAHSISIQKVTDGTWRIFVTGTTPFSGGSGAVVRIPMAVPATVEPGTSIAVPLSKGVVFKADGSQDPVDAINGVVKIAETEIALPDSPDFQVISLDVKECDVMPGDELEIKWNVVNNGTLDATGGWSERIFLTDESGARADLGTLQYAADRLRVGETVSRSVRLRIPELPGISGKLNVGVMLTGYATSGEIPALQLNNTLITSGAPVALGKRLLLEVPESVEEAASVNVRCKISRSGDWTMAETFTIEKLKGDSRLRLPEKVVIPRGQSGAYFMAVVNGNDILDESGECRLRVSGNGYDPVEGGFEIVDDEFPEIEILFSDDPLTEGETTTLVITLPRATTTDTEITLMCEAPERFTFPGKIIIPKGESGAKVDLTAVDDDRIETEKEVMFKATAPHYGDGVAYLTLLDNDMPALSMTLTPNEVSEGAGMRAIRGKLVRTSNFDKQVTILFSDNRPGNLDYTGRLTMAKGVEEVDFTIGVIDNAKVEGDRQIEFSAAVFLQGCSCSASSQSGGMVSGTITVIDNDGPALSLSCGNATFRKENRETTITVERNTSSRDPLTVTLTASPAGIVEIPASVLIPVGESKAKVKVTAPLSSFTGVERNITVNAEAEGFAKGTMLMLLSDRTLPDATVAVEPLQQGEFIPGEKIKVKVTVGNEGNTVMPDAVPVDIYLSDSKEVALTLHTTKRLEAGKSEELSGEVAAPSIPGSYTLTAVVNEANNFQELTRMNNSAEPVAIIVKSPFNASFDVASKTVSEGETVKVSGIAPGFGSDLELYYISGGTRLTQKVTPDSDGRFSAEIKPEFAGDFIAGVCIPGEGKNEEMGRFTVRGITAANSGYLTFDLATDDTSERTFKVTNRSSEPVKGLKAVLGSLPEGCEIEVDCPEEIAVNAAVNVKLTVKGTAVTPGSDWTYIPLEITGEQGERLTKTIYYYCRAARANLVPSVSSINTTMTMGVPRVYRFSLGNNGKGATGDITLSLPAFMQNGTTLTLPSLASNETMNVDILLTPNSSMQLNVPVSGKIGVNCANGNGVAIPYSVEPVSDSKGTLRVDVKDEFTFATAEAPHVAGATVMVTHPVTGRLISSGDCDENGLWSTELPEGFYTLSVSADRHEGWSGTIQVAPGKVNDIPVFLPFNAISYSWHVEETTVDDTYEIVTTVEFETRVPKPVVVVDFPNIPYRNQLVYYTATNKGLVTATNVTLVVPESTEEMQFEIIGPDVIPELLPGMTVRFPVKVTVDEDDKYTGGSPAVSSYTFRGDMVESNTRGLTRADSGSGSGCFTGQHEIEIDSYDCDPLTGEPIYGKKKSVMANYNYGDCGNPRGWTYIGGIKTPGGGGGGGGAGGAGGPGGPGGSAPVSGEYSTYLADRLRTILMTGCLSDCEKALADAIKACYDAVKDCTPTPDGDDFDIEDCVDRINEKCSEVESGWDAADCAAGAAGCIPKLGCPVAIYDCLRSAYEAFKKCMELKKHLDENGKKSAVTRADDAGPSADVDTRVEALLLLAERFDIVRANIWNTLGTGGWSRVSGAEVGEMMSKLMEHRDADGYLVINEAVVAARPESVDEESYKDFLTRFNNTVRFELTGEKSDNMIDLEAFNANQERVEEIIVRSSELGFPSFAAMADVAIEEAEHIRKMNEEPSSGVCATVTIKFNQTMVLTRQAFRGTLTITNGNEEVAMRDVTLNVKIRDNEGNLVGEREFAVAPETLDGFNGELNLTSGWELDPKATGSATILFIPSKYAAPVEPLVYSFGGTLGYTDPFTGNAVTLELAPIEMTVSPSPLLQLDYFMQRDIIGDDPLTEEVVEASESAEFALLIRNAGFGDADNLRMTTAQPEITDNRRGLALDFRIIGTSLDGETANVAIGEKIPTEFGTLKAGATTYAQWWLHSSLLGHFVSYDVKATQLSAYGSEDMSLLDYTEIHELIHGFTPEEGEATSRAFLVNDIEDTEGLPDLIFFTDDAASATVAKAQSMAVAQIEENVYKVTVRASAPGWIYAGVSAPWKGKREVVKVERLSDGKELPADNFWATFVTLKNSTDPIYEDKLHGAVQLTGMEESYRVTLAPRPELPLDVVRYDGVPKEGESSLKPVAEIGVTFNKPVDPSTFGASAISLKCQGKPVDTSGVKITPASGDNSAFTLDLGKASAENGYYILTVDLTSITDGEGFNGEKMSAVSWIQFADGNLTVTVKADPKEGGEVSPRSATVQVGETVKLSAVPSEGYEFIGWTNGSDMLSSEPKYEFFPKDDTELTAGFRKLRHMAEVIADESEGALTGSASGIYDYGTTLILEAEALPGYRFVKWVDAEGEEVSSEPRLSLTVKSDVYLKAVFVYEGTGVAEIVDNGVKSLYPVPARDHIFISGDFEVADMVTVTDLDGRHVKIVRNYRSGNALDVSSLAKGTYIVRVKTLKGTSTHRMIKH